MGIDKVTPCQLALSVRSLDAGSTDSMNSFSSNKSTRSGDQVCFGSINFRPHPPALLPVFGDFSRGVDLAIGSFDFNIGTQGTLRRSEPICSGSTAEASASPTASSASSIGSMGGKQSAMMTRSNIGSTASMGDLVDLLDGVSFGSSSTTNSNTSSGRVHQHENSENIDNERDDDDSADSGIRKVDSYPNFCTNKTHLAHHHVCMVDISRHSGEDR